MKIVMASNTMTAESPILNYLNNYIDLTNNFPTDMARLMSELHQIDVKVARYINLLDFYKKRIQNDLMEEKIMIVLEKIERILLDLEKESDSKLDVVKSMLEQIDLKSRQLEASHKLATINANPNHHLHVSNSLQCNSSTNSNYKSAGLNQSKNESTLNDHDSPAESNKEKDNINSPANNGKRMKRGSNKNNNNINNSLSQDTNNNGSGDEPSTTLVTTNSAKRGNGKRALKTNNKAEKKGKTDSTNIADNGDGGENNDEPVANDESYDPNEPTYCLCKQVSYGEMICCDNDQCSIEWFHFKCVSLGGKPKGRWFCPQCRGERSNIQRK